jgi:hypothetical protein
MSSHGSRRPLPSDFRQAPGTRPRYKDPQKQKLFSALLAAAVDLRSELFHEGRPRRGDAHRAAFWDGYAGVQRSADIVPGSLSGVAFAAGREFASTNPGIPKEDALPVARGQG